MRVALVLLATAVLAWSAVLIRDARVADVTDPHALNAPTGPAAMAAADDLRRARLLNPDGTLEAWQALYEVRGGELRGALARGLAVTRREPDNLDAWVAVWAASGRLGDRASLARASSQIRRLTGRS
ncbi:unannotated protein [freshwater metagenome]|uniref:Unannotated protein n=1 Tax=freshwater metagenome TaxID=449393 RepID=A0A6J7IID8_9ZZZZ|nr:hypothetical protein [Actinomycetota bacterium]